jgi:hypothetical protein
LVQGTVGLIGIGQPRARFAQVHDGLTGGLSEQGLVDPFIEFVN